MAAQFICAADEVGRLQSGDDAECRLFQQIAEQGHYAGITRPSATRQGTYATTAGGVFLASWNSNDPRYVAQKLRVALDRWKQLAPGERKRGADAEAAAARLDRPERFFPEGGLVLRVNTRDLPREQPQTGRWAKAWNQDFAWFTRAEARRFVPGSLRPGATADVPQPLIERLARLHLVDNVRGQTSPFPAGSVERARLESRVVAVDGETVTLRFEGETRTATEGKWPIRGYRDMNQPSRQKRGVETRLLGRAKYDTKEGRFVSLELVAVGTRWRGTQYNGRANDLAPAPYGAVLALAGKRPAERVAPEHFWAYGWR
jgi:hypothetical protein